MASKMVFMLLLAVSVIGELQADVYTGCENERLALKCPGKMAPEIQSAIWGRQAGATCPNPTTANMSCSSDITDLVKEKCTPEKCAFSPNIRSFGTPCEGSSTLIITVEYSCTPVPPTPGCTLPATDSFQNGEVKQAVDWIGIDMIWFKCDEGFELYGNPALVCRDNSWNGSLPVCAARDCMAHRSLGRDQDGVYGIIPDGKTPRLVYCDMTTDGGGWTVFQRRVDGSVSFYRDYEGYQHGFGDLEANIWIGLDVMHTLSKPDTELYVNMVANETHEAFARYNSFSVGSEAEDYKLTISGYSGDAGDSLTSQNGMKFTTYDRDQDGYDTGNCAVLYTGAWWYDACHQSNLNGFYHDGPHTSYADGINWLSYTTYYYSLQYVDMKMRRKV